MRNVLERRELGLEGMCRHIMTHSVLSPRDKCASQNKVT